MGVAERRRASRVRANVVALHHIARAAGAAGNDVDSILTVARNDVATGRGCAANGDIDTAIQHHAVECVANTCRASGVGADQVARHQRSRGIGSRDRHAVTTVARNDVARASDGAANRVAGDIRDRHAAASIAERRRAKRIGANVVALHQVAGCASAHNDDAALRIARNNVASARDRATNRGGGCTIKHHADGIAKRRRAKRVGANVVALHQGVA